jgi:protein arginine N-methyltransferase 3
MGYCLLYEAMLDSVLWARDRYLAPDGLSKLHYCPSDFFASDSENLVVPSHCTLHVAPVSDPDYVADHISFWHSVYGFSMSSMLAGIHKEANIRHLSPSAVVGSSSIFLQLPLHSITPEELTFDRGWESIIDQDADALDGFAIWFDTFFLLSRRDTVPADARAEEWKGSGVAFTTGPNGKETHWQQGLLLINREKGARDAVELKKGQRVNGQISYKKQDHNSRELGIEMEWVVDSSGERREQGKQQWAL